MGSEETYEAEAWESPVTESLAGDPSAGASSIDHLVPGVVLAGKYRLGDRIGSGGMGAVYEAQHLKLRQPVALKIPFASRISANAASRLLREARVAAALDPERTARVFDVGTLDDGTPFLVLERLEGENLAELVASLGPRPVTEAVDLVTAACLGVVEAHRRGIVHRDLKPSNLFLARKPDGTTALKVLDFGIASIRAEEATGEGDATLTRTGAMLGSPPYMAPEQLRSASEVDARADVWALGVTLHQLLTGKLPFPGQGSALVAAIAADPPRQPRDEGVEIPDGLARVLAECLCKVPAKRPADAAALARALLPHASAAGRRAIENEVGRGGTRARPAVRPALLGGAAVVALGAALALGTATRPVAPPPSPRVTEETAAATPEPTTTPVAPAPSAATAQSPSPAASHVPRVARMAGPNRAAPTPPREQRAPAPEPAPLEPTPPPAPPPPAPPASTTASSAAPTAPAPSAGALLDAREF